MAKVDVENAGTYITIPRKIYKKWMKILRENPESDSFTFCIKGWHDVEIFPEDYKTGLAGGREKMPGRVWTDCKHGRWLSPCPICKEENKVSTRIITPEG